MRDLSKAIHMQEQAGDISMSIVRKVTDFCTIAYDGNKMGNAAIAAYWLSCEGSTLGGLQVQQDDIVSAFKSIANALGYRVEKIEPEEMVTVSTIDTDQDGNHIEKEIPAWWLESTKLANVSPLPADNGRAE